MSLLVSSCLSECLVWICAPALLYEVVQSMQVQVPSSHDGEQDGEAWVAAVGSSCHGNACNRLQAFKHNVAQRVACAKDGFRRANICAWCIRSFVSVVVCCHSMHARSRICGRVVTLAARWLHSIALLRVRTSRSMRHCKKSDHSTAVFSGQCSLRSYAVWPGFSLTHSCNGDVHMCR
jgi:hypothetical protein